MRRILLILSVVGLVGSIALWVVSSGVDCLFQQPALALLCIRSGILTVSPGPVSSIPPGLQCRALRQFETHWWPPGGVFLHESGFVTLPLWMPVLVSAASLSLLLRRRRRRPGFCVACGYDLQGSPDGKCSECGCERG
jgi:hypothetical protein